MSISLLRRAAVVPRRWQQPFSLRFRVIALLLLLATPLVGMAVLVSWQDYQFERALPLGGMQMMRRITAPAARSAIGGLRDLLETLARSPEVRGGNPAVCDLYLARLVDTSQTGFASMRVADANGQVWCAVPSSLADRTQPESRLNGQPSFEAAVHERAFDISGMALVTSAQPSQIFAVDPILENGAVLGVVAASLLPSWFADRVLPPEPGLAAWLVDPDVGWLPIFANGTAAEPPADLRRHLFRGDLLTEATSDGGRRTAYGSMAIGNGLRLVIARDVSRPIADATRRLIDRTGLLVALLAAAIGAVVVGADRGIVAPVRRVSRAVRDWRQGEPFRLDHAKDLSPELQILATTFGAAVDGLANREADLRRAVTQQELAMQEIHHRVKNNLQIVASLLNLQASRIRQPEARAEFQSARDRVRALATLHRHLYVQGELHTIDMRDFLTELCGQLFQAMGEVEGERISLEIDAPALQMLSDQAVPLALIVTEAVGNALKYAFPAGRPGRIIVSLHGNDDSARLIVQDNGIGIPAGRAETETGTRDGLGLQLIRGFARQLGAALTVDQGDGTRYVVEMPLQRHRDAAADRPRTLAPKVAS